MDHQSFTQQKEVLDCLQQLRAKFTDDHPLVVSDVLDQEGRQYVNLVQKGGGVLGVALVGYTYILEQMNIRFLRLAGTSAGAINTALLVAVGKKEESKSERILDILCNLNFFNLVDGHPAARWLIKNFITHDNFTQLIKSRIMILTGILGFLLFADLALLGLEKQYPHLQNVTQTFFVLTGFVLVVAGALAVYALRLLGRLKQSGFGINPGDFFYDWIRDRFKENGIKTVSDLNNKAAEAPPLRLRPERADETLHELSGDVTFITSELVSENKIQFPKMAYLFREPENIDKDLRPAGFVRASMAIPLFFESYFINDIPADSPRIQQAWKDTLNENKPPVTARFVDGGLLSNFPINLFFNPRIVTPRLPTFGIDLNDSGEEDHSLDADRWSFGGYAGRMINTLRGLYDKDFLIQNKAFELGIGSIPLQGFNWLNFFLSDEDKKRMFVLGAQAATQFLMEFDWEGYKQAQSQMRKDIRK